MIPDMGISLVIAAMADGARCSLGGTVRVLLVAASARRRPFMHLNLSSSHACTRGHMSCPTVVCTQSQVCEPSGPETAELLAGYFLPIGGNPSTHWR